MGNSRRGFGLFTDTGKFPARWVKSPYSIRSCNLAMDVPVGGNTH
jgi:hypothetical protein